MVLGKLEYRWTDGQKYIDILYIVYLSNKVKYKLRREVQHRLESEVVCELRT